MFNNQDLGRRTVRVGNNIGTFEDNLIIKMREEQSSTVFKQGTADAGSQGKGDNFKTLVTESPVAIYTCDSEGYITFYNEAAARLWGVNPEVNKHKWTGSWKIFYPDGRNMLLEESPIALTLKGEEFLKGEEVVIERPDHTFRNLLVYPKALYDNENNITGAHNTLVDITDQKTGEEKQAILSAIVESSDDAIISKNLKGKITSWNAGAERIFGFRESEAVGRHISILIPSHLLFEEETIISSIRSGKKIDHFQTTRLHKTGREIAVSITVSPVRDISGNVTGASKIARDITAQLTTERIIRQTAERMEILNSVGKAVSENLDVKEILQKVTDATTNITGAEFGVFFYNAKDERGKPSMLYTLSGASKDAFEKIGMIRDADVFHPTFSGARVLRSADITKDPRYGKIDPYADLIGSTLKIVSYLAVPIRSGNDNIIGELFFGHRLPGVFLQEHEDMVVSIASQAAVALDNSMLFEEVKELSAKKDEFIALASHELKTPLTTIKAYLQILEKSVQDKVGRMFLNKSMHQVEKLNGLVSDLFDISKVDAGKMSFNYESFNLSLFLSQTLDTFHYNTTSHKIIFDDQGAGVSIEADRQRLEQVINNLVNNAIKYSPQADEVSIKLDVKDDRAVISIRDEGFGLSFEQQKHVFTRFYRAESTSRISGLGLGLYLSKEIIDRHGGNIGVKSETGKGSVFTVTLPLKRNFGNN